MNVGILGLGLIGGSLGFDLRACGHHIIGVSHRASTIETALAIGCVDQASVDINILGAAEVVFICTPLGLIVPTIEQLITVLPQTSVITDVGSVKTPIVKASLSLWQNFVGGHPMAGTEASGIEAALKDLFVEKPYVLTPTPTTPASATEVVSKLIKQLNSNIYYCTPEQHDRAVSWISHLPVMVSASLIASCLEEKDLEVLELAKNLASSGFKDTSRVGGGNPELGVMMAKYNREALLKSMHQYRHKFDEIIDLIEQKNWTHLENILKSNQQRRPDFL
ncbi:arogenate dehydrogenase [Calothrix sp. NIES-4071]|nr:arogenate dehydrogenase [Calothrix sp. NIES-4071]BAZ58227.1 arogenate dehydrogenase [Calothrix sp. NIES-4105]